MAEIPAWRYTLPVRSQHVTSIYKSESYGPIVAATFSTLLLLYAFQERNKSGQNSSQNKQQRSTTLPGFGILGDRVNELIEIFLDGLAIYVHNDRKWDCQRKLLCEANQRAAEYGYFHTVLMYFTSLGVSFLLRDQRVSESMKAMRKGRHGHDCTTNYPQCPF